MKELLYFLIALILFSCSQKVEPLKPDSIFNVNSEWEKQDGSKISLKDFKGKVIVTAMIFTSCKTACPRLTSVLLRHHPDRQTGQGDIEQDAGHDVGVRVV